MSNKRTRNESAGMTRAAFWLPIFFGAALAAGGSAHAQTTGLPSPSSGDCSTNTAGVVTCTRTNGTSFAPSATTDTTNAGNITSGVLPASRGGTGAGALTGLRMANGAAPDTAAAPGVAYEGAIVETTYAALPASGAYVGQKLLITDGVAGSGCSTGGGALRRLCEWTGGGTWVAINIPPAEKNIANGVVGLDANARINATQMPALTGDCTTLAGAVQTTCSGIATNAAAVVSEKNRATAAEGSIAAAAANASNLTSGTVPVAQSAAITGDVTKAAGSSTSTVTAVNGGAVPASATSLTTNAAGKFVAVQNLMRYHGYGDSYNRGIGSTSLGRSHLNLLANDIVSRTPWQNYAVGGTTAAQIALQVYANWIQDPTLPSLAVLDAGNNDYTQDTCTKTAGTTNTLCQMNFSQTLSAALSWMLVPNANKIFAAAASQGGAVWSSDNAVPMAAQSGIGSSAGDSAALYTNVSGASLTFNVPANNRGVIGTTQWTRNGFTGTYTVSIDGTLQTNPCTNTTTFSSGPCGGQAMVYANAGGLGAALSVPQRNRFAVTAGVAHTVVITLTNAQYLEFQYVDYMPATLPANANYAVVDNSGAAFDISGVYSAAAQALVSQLASDGQQVILADVRSALSALPGGGTSGTASTLCPATTYVGHPNDCGFRAMYNAERAALNNFVVTLAANNAGGQQTSNSGDIYGPFRWFGPLNVFGLTPSTYLAQFNPTAVAYGPGISIQDNGSQLVGLNVAYGSVANGSSSTLTNLFSTYAYTCMSNVSGYAMDQYGMVSGSRRWCHDNNTGNTYQMGTSTATRQISTVTTAAGFNAQLFTPASSSAACAAGDFADDANYHYVCTAANTWKRVALAAF